MHRVVRVVHGPAPRAGLPPLPVKGKRVKEQRVRLRRIGGAADTETDEEVGTVARLEPEAVGAPKDVCAVNGPRTAANDTRLTTLTSFRFS